MSYLFLSCSFLLRVKEVSIKCTFRSIRLLSGSKKSYWVLHLLNSSLYHSNFQFSWVDSFFPFYYSRSFCNFHPSNRKRVYDFLRIFMTTKTVVGLRFIRPPPLCILFQFSPSILYFILTLFAFYDRQGKQYYWCFTRIYWIKWMKWPRKILRLDSTQLVLAKHYMTQNAFIESAECSWIFICTPNRMCRIILLFPSWIYLFYRCKLTWSGSNRFNVFIVFHCNTTARF